MKYFVSMAVDGRIEVEVEASSPKEAYEKAAEEFCDVDLSKMDYVDANPVSCTDEDGNMTEF